MKTPLAALELVMFYVFLALLALLGPLSYFCGVDSRIVDTRDTRRWI